jgi:hypothetical protein
MKLTDEEQCMLDMMEITGFPMEIKHGLYTYERYIASGVGEISFSGKTATADFSKVVKVFNKWKENRNEN